MCWYILIHTHTISHTVFNHVSIIYLVWTLKHENKSMQTHIWDVIIGDSSKQKTSLSFELLVTEISPCQKSATLKFNPSWRYTAAGTEWTAGTFSNQTTPGDPWISLYCLSHAPLAWTQSGAKHTSWTAIHGSVCQGIFPPQPTPHSGKSLW